MRLFGFRALITMRLEKSFGTWYREYRPIYTPLEAGMDRVLKFDHDFIGREAVEAEIAAGGPKRKLVMFEVDVDPDAPADVIGDEPVWHDGRGASAGSRPAATPTTRACRWRSATSRPSSPTPTAGFEIEIIGRRRPAAICSTSRCSTRRASACVRSTCRVEIVVESRGTPRSNRAPEHLAGR